MNLKLATIFVWLLWSTAVCAQVGLSSEEQKIFNLVNQERRQAGLPPFQWNYHLAEAARGHTQLMAQRKVLTHQFASEDPLGDRIGATGLRFSGAAENVAQADTKGDIATTLHLALMSSPPHRGNILSPKYNALGLAIVSKGDDAFVTEDFANVLPAYSEEQFRDGVITAFNKARQTHRVPAIRVGDDARVRTLACSQSGKPQIPDGFANALEVVAFTSSDPAELPADMQKLVDDAGLHRMNVAACFRPDKQHGYGNFWVVAAFYP